MGEINSQGADPVSVNSTCLCLHATNAELTYEQSANSPSEKVFHALG